MSNAKRQGKRSMRAATATPTLRLGVVDVDMAAESAYAGRPTTFRLVAYTGGPMNVGWGRPVVVDLAGLSVSKRPRPVLRDHDSARIVGHTDVVTNDGRRLEVTGVVSGSSADADQVVAAARRGFPWRVSIGATVKKSREVRAGESVRINGQTIAGPVTVAEESVLAELSFVSLGADDDTDASVAATAAKGAAMKFGEWLQANGWDADTLTDTQRATLEAAYQADTATGTDDGTPAASADVERELAANARTIAAEKRRVAGVLEAAGDHHHIAATAVEKKWTIEATQVAVLRAERGTMGAPSIGTTTTKRDAGGGVDTDTVEAGLLMSMGHPEPDLVASYGERVLDRVDRQGLRALGLRDAAKLCAQIDGATDLPAVFGDGTRVLRAATSTHSLGAVVDNVLSKVALNIYNGGERPAEAVSRVGNVSDFKTTNRYRLGGTGKFERVAPGGKVPSGVVSDDTYTNQADTYGQVINIDRKDFINDDAGVLNDLGTEMGFAALEALNHAAFELLLSNPSTFFGTANGNNVSGAASALGDESLRVAHATFRNLKKNPTGKKGDARRVNIMPRVLLVPPTLEHTAMELVGSPSIDTATGSDTTLRRGTMNTHRGRYEVVVAPHLEDTAVHSSASAATWYLMADPRMVAAMEIVFLNGRRRPVFERIPTASDVLGLTFRAHFDFGVAMQDPFGAVRSVGS
jgi:uncharacterized protein YbaA (DUF1428 family)